MITKEYPRKCKILTVFSRAGMREYTESAAPHLKGTALWNITDPVSLPPSRRFARRRCRGLLLGQHFGVDLWKAPLERAVPQGPPLGQIPDDRAPQPSADKAEADLYRRDLPGIFVFQTGHLLAGLSPRNAGPQRDGCAKPIMADFFPKDHTRFAGVRPSHKTTRRSAAHRGGRGRSKGRNACG